MKKRIDILALVAVLVLVLLRASLAEGEANASKDTEADDLPDKQTLRDPFWPRGHVARVPKAPKKQGENAPRYVEPIGGEKWPELPVKGIMRSARGYIAILEDVGMVEEGQIISKTVGRIEFFWKVEKILEKSVKLIKLEARQAQRNVIEH